MVKTKKNNLSLQPYTPATGSVPASHKNLLRMYYQVSLEDKHSGEFTEVFFVKMRNPFADGGLEQRV